MLSLRRIQSLCTTSLRSILHQSKSTLTIFQGHAATKRTKNTFKLPSSNDLHIKDETAETIKSVPENQKSAKAIIENDKPKKLSAREKGEILESASLEVLSSLGLTLHRSGGPFDRGVDLYGGWRRKNGIWIKTIGKDRKQ